MQNSTTIMNGTDALHDSSALRHKENSELLQILILSTVGFFGICGNVLILITGIKTLSKLFRVPKVGSYQDYRASFITSLAMADIMSLSCGVPMHLAMTKNIPFSSFVCHVIVPFRDVFPLISILTIMAISLERAVAIVYPFAYEMTQKHIKYAIAATWLIGYLIAGLPMVFVMQSTESGLCLSGWQTIELRRLHQASAVALIVLPGIVTTCSYMFCLSSLRKFRRRRTIGSVDSNSIGQLKFVEQSRSISRIAVVLIVVYWCCNLPLVIYAILVNNNLVRLTYVQIAYSSAIFICLYFSSSMISPVVLVIMSPVYRRGATGCLNYWCTKRKIQFNYSFSTRTQSLYSRDPTSKSDGILMQRLHESEL